ncbi:MAG: TIM barrel protein [Victivallaceae bacterium]
MSESAVKIGVCSWSFWQDLPEQLKFLVENKFTATSLLQHIMKADKILRRDCAQMIKENNLTLTWHSNVLDEHVVNGEINQDYLKQLYDDVVWWHENTNGVFSSCSDGNVRKINFDHVNYMNKRLAALNIRYGLENSCTANHKQFTSIEQIQALKNDVAATPLFGMLFDAGHGWVFSKQNNLNFEDYIASIPVEIHEVHISDNLGANDDHLPLGDGEMDLPALMRGLKRKYFQGVFTLESLRKRDRAAFDLTVDIDRAKVLEYKEVITEAWAKVN